MERRILAPSYVETHLALRSDAWREKHIFLCSFSLRIYETSQQNQKDSKSKNDLYYFKASSSLVST
jgi:hypothetical protein